jgi:hypothetical protein
MRKDEEVAEGWSKPLKAGFNPQVRTGHAGTCHYKSFVHRLQVKDRSENLIL